MADYLLLTGATGLLGRYLVRDLLLEGKQLAVLVRSSKRESAVERVEGIMQMWEEQLGKWLPRPVVLEGDICQPLLGLSADDRHWVTRNCSELMHSAASLTFHADGTGEPWTSNFGGTKNMLDLCQATGIRNLHYVSTAYVCGLREGMMYETELDCGQAFRNDYEESKLKSEQLVRDAKFIDKLTVYRPAVIAGDSVNGYTSTYHGIYLYLRMMSLLVPRQPVGPDGKRHTPLRLPMRGDERRNVIPINWVSEVITHLYLSPQSHGRTFHLSPKKHVTPRDILNAGFSYFNSTGAEYVGYDGVDPATYNDFEAETLPAFAMYDNYKATDPEFDCSNLDKFAGHIPCPEIDETVLHKYIRFGEEDRWGKRRVKPADFDRFVVDCFAAIQLDSEAFASECRPLLSLDLHGAGGGQWTLGLDSKGKLASCPGFNSSLDSVLRMSVEDFRKVLSEGGFAAMQGRGATAMESIHEHVLPLFSTTDWMDQEAS